MSNQDQPTRVKIGFGSLDSLAGLLEKEPLGHAAVLCGSWIRKSDHLRRIIQQLNRLGMEHSLLPGIPWEPYSDHVDRFAHQLRQTGADMVIAIGGGSVMDLAKFAAWLACNPGQCADFDGGPNMDRPGLPMLMIPTTAGTGSEVTPYSVINNSITGKKFTISSPFFVPRWAIIDPHLTRSLPPDIRLATALDAWVHCLEAYTSAEPKLEADGHALEGLRLVFEHLPKAMVNPLDEHLDALARAALYGGMAISHARTGLIHTASVALARFCNLPHGLLNAVITPHVMRFNLDAYNDRLLDLLPDCNQPHEVLDGVIRFLGDLKVPSGLDLPDYDEAMVQALITRVRMDGGLPGVNPKPIGDDDLRRLFDSIVAGGVS